MFYRKRRFQRRPIKGRKIVARKGKRGVTRAVKSYVKRLIHKNIENKIVIDNAANQGITTATVGQAVYYIPLVPSIGQGPAGNGRIGNEVRVRKAWIKGYVNLLPYNITTNPTLPLRVRMFLVSSKMQNMAANNGAPPPTTDFFQSGAGQNSPFVGNMLDIVRSVNTDNWTLHAQKNIELGLTAQYGTFGGYADNSKFTAPFYFNFAKHLGRVKFDDGGNYSTNKSLFLFIQVVAADGSSSAYISAEEHHNIRYEYEDA